MSVDAIGPVWGEAEIDAADPDTTWVHLAPLLRTDFPAETLALLAARGHRVAYDGQGLVRADRLGPLVEDRHFAPDLLAPPQRPQARRGRGRRRRRRRRSTQTTAERLGVPEIVVTYGSEGCDIYTEATVVRVPAAWRVEGVQTTGAGDMFTACYVANRAAGADPREPPNVASELVARELEKRPAGRLARPV